MQMHVLTVQLALTLAQLELSRQSSSCTHQAPANHDFKHVAGVHTKLSFWGSFFFFGGGCPPRRVQERHRRRVHQEQEGSPSELSPHVPATLRCRARSARLTPLISRTIARLAQVPSVLPSQWGRILPSYSYTCALIKEAEWLSQQPRCLPVSRCI